MDIAIIVIYLAAMLAFGFWGKRRAHNSSEYLVAGRRLGGGLYMGTLVAVVIGGASTIGGVGLGYTQGMAGMWLVVAIATGVIVLSLFFAGRIQKIKVFTVAGMLRLRYGIDATGLSGIVMMAYTLMLTVTSTVAYATIFTVLFDIDRTWAIVLGAGVVIVYSAMGGMWSITLADMVQFAIMTVGVFLLLLPFTWNRAGGFDGIRERVGDDAFNIFSIEFGTVITFFVIYTFGILIGQDIWQRVFTARSPKVARWGGVAAGVYCLVYGVAGAAIGLAASAIMPNIEVSDDVYATVAVEIVPVGLSGLVLAAAVAAMMSTASGALIAAANVTRQDVVPFIARLFGKTAPYSGDGGDAKADVRGNRLYVIGIGLLTAVISILVNDVLTGLTVAYGILVGGLLVPILGGLIWRRATGLGAVAAMVVGTAVTLISMGVFGVDANEPVYYGMAAAAITFVIASLLTPATPALVMREWDVRASGEDDAGTTGDGPELAGDNADVAR